MAQTTRQLEQRLARVEKELAEIKTTLAGKPTRPWYEEIVGVFKDDKAFSEIVRLGRLIRQGKINGDHPPVKSIVSVSPNVSAHL